MTLVLGSGGIKALAGQQAGLRELRELLARRAAALRTATRRADSISATDAIVAAFAERSPDPVVMTSDPDDLAALTARAQRPVMIIRV